MLSFNKKPGEAPGFLLNILPLLMLLLD